jgi:hypothetical protein
MDSDTADIDQTAGLTQRAQPVVDAAFPGLSTVEARELLETVGPNAISENEPTSWQILVHHLWARFPGCSRSRSSSSSFSDASLRLR